MERKRRLPNFKISFFAIVMGLSGFTVAWQKAEGLLEWENFLSQGLLALTASLFLLIGITYVIKALNYPDIVRQEFNHPVSLSFFPTITISLLLLSTAFFASNEGISSVLWFVGAPLHLIFSLLILSIWMRQSKFEIQHFSPAWMIPVVGNLLVPVVGLHFVSVEILWFYFSFAIVFWVIFFTIFIYRIFFHSPLPDKLLPTLFILIAPPAVGFIAYVKLTGEVDGFARILYYLAVFLVLFLLAQAPMFARLKFFLSWWAYSFPLAAMTIATALMLDETGINFFRGFFFGLLVVLTALIALLSVLTVRHALRQEICVEEG